MRWRLLACAATLAAGCFSGDATLGAICREDADCGAEQACANEVCGLCADGVVDPGEVCVAAAEVLELGVAVEEAVVVELDRDGRLDLVVTKGASVVALHGGLAPAPPVPVEGVRGLRSADVDDDGLADVLAFTASGLTVLYGDGTGNLSAEAVIEADVVDALGDPGRGVLTAMGREVTVHALSADRSLVPEVPLDVGGEVQRLLGPALTDADAIPDAIAVLQGGAVRVLLGRAQGFETRAVEGFGESVREASLVDFDGDARPDVVAITETDRILVLDGDGQGGFVAGASVDTAAGVRAVGFADLNGDLELDVLAVPGSGGLWLHLARGRVLQPGTELPGPGPWRSVLMHANFDADLHRDLLTQHEDGRLFLMRGVP